MSGVSLSDIEPFPAGVTAGDPEAAAVRAVVFGCAGTSLSPEERAFFQESQPLGFILFRRNVASPEQVKQLIQDLRAAVGRPGAPVLIDQEGGRVARLRPPHWPSHPPARQIGQLAERSPAAGREAAWLNGRLLALMLHEVGITVDCTPVCDVPIPHAHEVIGDRAFAEDPQLVSDLARALCDGLLAGGVLPVIKHIPGHGRARADSHEELPVVDASQEALAATDFVPFRKLADIPLGMVAHVVYRAIDPHRPASTSKEVISGIVRGLLGFDGLLLSDDLSMGALHGTPASRAGMVLAAGCDVVLHCNGRLDEMRQVAAVTPILEGMAAVRWLRARAALRQPQPVAAEVLRARLDQLLETTHAVLPEADPAAKDLDPTSYRLPPAAPEAADG